MNMPVKHTEQEVQTILQAIRKGWHIVPYTEASAVNGKKACIKWGSETREHLTTEQQVRQWDAQHKRMAFVLSTANAVLIDVDCGIPLYADQANGRTLEEHRDDVHAEWADTPIGLKHQILQALDSLATKAGVEPHAAMLSSSKNGSHSYYKCHTRKTDPGSIKRYLTSISTPDPCIELYANWRLAYPTNWEEMAKVVHCQTPMTYEKVVKYWSQKADDFNSYRIMQRNVAHEPKPPIEYTDKGGFSTDYHKLVENSNYAQVGNKCRCFVWLSRAYQLNDLEGVEAGRQDAAARGLSAEKIKIQEAGARRFAERHPCQQALSKIALANYNPTL